MADESISLRVQKRRLTEEKIAATALRLFDERSFEAVSVEDIAAAAEVAPRTFYRYFPTKEDVVLSIPGGVTVARNALAERRRGETDIQYIARAMIAVLTARTPEDAARMYRLVERTPSLQARAFQAIWGSQAVLVEALLASGPRNPEAEFRAHLLAQTVANLVRVAHFSWIRSGHRGSVWGPVQKALAVLQDAFDALPKKVRSKR